MPEFGIDFLHIDSAQIVFKNVQFGDKMVLDEVQLNGANIQLNLGLDTVPPVSVSSGETQFRALITEANLNALLAKNMPDDIPVKNLHLSLLSGKVKLSAQLNKMFKLPISVEGVLQVENGVKVFFEWQQVSAGGIPLPSQLVELLQQQINKSMDLGKSPVPVWLDWIRCEPGRLTISGKARLNFPISDSGKISVMNEHLPVAENVPVDPTSSI